jgi:putative protease
MEIPGIVSWKIEGRKKGPHYVYYVTTAYRMLRDHGRDPAARKEALGILDMALGRPFTRARFLPQKDSGPTAADGQTDSGLLAGKIARDDKGGFIVKPRFDLLPKDYLRIGVEDEAWHFTLPVTRRVPKGGTYTLKTPRHKSPKTGTPVFLIDRREPELAELLSQWEKRLSQAEARPGAEVEFAYKAPPAAATPGKSLDIILRGSLPKGREGKSGIKPGSVQGLWLSPKAVESVSRTLFSRISWWLPPVIWPDEEESWVKMVRLALRGGARHFVCNEPWQGTLFPEGEASLIAGPFCNITNAAAVAVLRGMGFSGAFVGPELGGEEMLSLPRACSLPLGVVLSGYWPVGIARHGIAPLKPEEPFHSPKGEGFWVRRYGQNSWMYPAWPLDIAARRQALEKAGYSMFAVFAEWPPQSVGEPKRTSEFNWDVGML